MVPKRYSGTTNSDTRLYNSTAGYRSPKTANFDEKALRTYGRTYGRINGPMALRTDSLSFRDAVASKNVNFPDVCTSFMFTNKPTDQCDEISVRFVVETRDRIFEKKIIESLSWRPRTDSKRWWKKIASNSSSRTPKWKTAELSVSALTAKTPSAKSPSKVSTTPAVADIAY